MNACSDLHARFGAALRWRRKQLRLTQAAAGARVGMHRAYWGALERGERNFRFDQLERLAAALDTELSVLFGYAESLRRASD